VGEHEPAHAFFKRLAIQNSPLSVVTFAANHGLNARNVVPQEFLAFCQRFPSRGMERLESATPRSDGSSVHLGGEVFNLYRDCSFRYPRICPACFAEAPFYRNWFDLTVVTRCPFHDHPLVSTAGRDTLAFWHPSFSQTPLGDDLTQRDGARVAALPDNWDRYVLGRVGVAPPLHCGFLDEHPMSEVIYAADVIGSAELSGWAAFGRDRMEKFDPRRGEALQLGFAVLRGGEPAIDNFLTRIAMSGPRRSDHPSITQFFGALRGTLLRLPDFALANVLREAMKRVALGHDVVSRKDRPPVDALRGASLTLNELAQTLRIKPARVREICERLGLVTSRKDKSVRHWLGPDAVVKLRSALDELVARPEAVRLTGLTAAEFRERCWLAGVSPLVRLWGSGPSSDRFMKSDLQALLPKRGPARPSRSQR